MPIRSYAWPLSHDDWYEHLAFHGVQASESIRRVSDEL